MTREEILAMVPGRELNALVAENVMGWIKGDSWGGAYWIRREDGASMALVEFWRPSSDLLPAWEVVERMLPRFTQLTRRHADVWYCGFSTVDSVEASTAPEAICKAALIEVLDL